MQFGIFDMMFQDFHGAEATKPARQAVLIVEDERISRRALALLMSASGYPTQAVASAEEALKVLKQGETPAIALVDLDLPGMSGAELLEYLNQKAPPIKTVLVTAACEERVAKLTEGAPLPYFRKPIDLNALLRTLAESPARN